MHPPCVIVVLCKQQFQVFYLVFLLRAGASRHNPTLTAPRGSSCSAIYHLSSPRASSHLRGGPLGHAGHFSPWLHPCESQKSRGCSRSRYPSAALGGSNNFALCLFSFSNPGLRHRARFSWEGTNHLSFFLRATPVDGAGVPRQQLPRVAACIASPAPSRDQMDVQNQHTAISIQTNIGGLFHTL